MRLTLDSRFGEEFDNNGDRECIGLFCPICHEEVPQDPENPYIIKDLINSDWAIYEVTNEMIYMGRECVNISYLCPSCDEIVEYHCDLSFFDDEELIELVEMEIRELLSFYKFDGDNTPVIQGSALGALNKEEKWVPSIIELMEACDTWIPLPERDVDKPFLMPVEDVFSITGRGTVATGRIESGVVNVGEPLDIIG